MLPRRVARELRELWWALPRLGRAGRGRATGVLSVWIWWDRFLQRRWRLTLVRPGGILRYRLAAYRGSAVRLNDGTAIKSGDRIVELHFDNATLMSVTGTSAWNPWEMMEGLDADLSELALLVSSGSLGDVRALHGVTLFAVPGGRLGFDIHPVPHTLVWSLRRYFLIGLIPIYHRDGWAEFDRMRRDRWPAELWMSTPALLGRRSRKHPLPERLKRSFRTSGATRVGRRARPPRNPGPPRASERGGKGEGHLS